MKSNQELFNERINRIITAINLGRPDRVPFVFIGDGFCANHMKIKITDFVKSPAYSNEVILKSVSEIGDVDGLGVTACWPDVLSFPSMSNIKIAGRDLPENAAWHFIIK
jgi:hypothetical protein